MSLSASHIYTLYRPSRCERRVFLEAHGEPSAGPSALDELLQELGERHELHHRSTFSAPLDLTSGSRDQRITKTLQAIENGVEVIYQGVFEAPLPGHGGTVIGIPDFLIREGTGYAIRDCKLSRHVGEGRHEEILLQLELYGWLFEQNLRSPPVALEVYLGDGSLVRLAYNGGISALQVLERIHGLVEQQDEPLSPVGWSKCGGCGFRERCWRIAEEMNDVALVYELDQATAIALKHMGITSIKELLEHFDKHTLSQVKKLRGGKMVRVGSAAERILLQAQALDTGKETLLKPLELPISENMVMFDLEGLPPQFDELDKVYLWGMQVFGKRPGKFVPALAGFGKEGDREGWQLFLRQADGIFSEYGNIPFIHWHNYETTKIKGYINRYGDPDGIAERVLGNCVDLLKITREALVLPEYSYSLKIIEQRAGFKRTMADYGGDWSIVQYIKAVETEDTELRNQLMSDILKYNEEDLHATWAVFQWLARKNNT